MGSVQLHTCGAEIVQAASFVTPPVFYDRRGLHEIERCPLCGKKLHTGQLQYVRPFVQGDPANYEPEGAQGAITYHAGICSGCGLYSASLSPRGHCVNCSILDRTPAPDSPF